MVFEGMVNEGLAVMRSIHDRYHPSRRNPYNEVECSDHYARAMASYGVYLAACGWSYDGPAARLGIAPRIRPDDFRAAFTAAEGWGTISQRRSGSVHSITIEVHHGEVALRSIDCATSIAKPTSALATVTDGGGAKPPSLVSMTDTSPSVSVDLGAVVRLRAGERLELLLRA
jgi:non-lysosomal glucosylceramidase